MAVEIGRAVVGKVIRVNTLWKAMRVSVQNMVLDENTNVFVNRETTCWASDPDLKTRVGDLVLIKPLDKKPRVEITHSLKEVVFPVGAVIEPITGKQCRGTEYVDKKNRNLN